MEAQKDESSTRLVSTACISLPKSFIHPQPALPLNTGKKGSPVFILDLDCSDPKSLQALGDSVDHPVFVLLWTNDTPTSNVESMASWYLQEMRTISQQSAHIIAHTSAGVLAFEMLLQDQKSIGSIQSLTILNGSEALVKAVTPQPVISESGLLYEIVEKYILTPGNKLKEKLSKASSSDQKLRVVVDLFTKSSSETVNKAELSKIIAAHVSKVRVLDDYTPREKMTTDLIIVEDSSRLLANDVAEVKIMLTEICSGKISIHRFPGIESLAEESVKMFVDCLSSVL